MQGSKQVHTIHRPKTDPKRGWAGIPSTFGMQTYATTVIGAEIRYTKPAQPLFLAEQAYSPRSHLYARAGKFRSDVGSESEKPQSLLC